MSNKIKLWTGLTLGVLTAVLLGWHSVSLDRAQRAAAFLRLSPNVAAPQGSPVPESALTTIELPESAGALRTVAIPDTPENREWLKGRKTSRDIAPGSIILYQFFADDPAERFAAKIAPGKRAMSVRVDAAAAVSYLIEPGSIVDVIGTLQPELKLPGHGERVDPQTLGRATTETILQAVRVLAVGSVTSRGGYTESRQPSFATVTFELAPEQVEKLVYAQGHLQNGGLTMVLRNPSDQAPVTLPAKTWSEASADSSAR